MNTNIYNVKDNGRRSFIPPCFCWDVVSTSTNEKTVVSEIDLSQLSVSETEKESLMMSLARGERIAEGFISDTDIPPGGLAHGKKLVVIRLPGGGK